MKYQTQRIAYAYFAVALALFAIQVLGGLAGRLESTSRPTALSELRAPSTSSA